MIPFDELARQVMHFVGKAILPNFRSYWLQDLLDHSEDSVFSTHYCTRVHKGLDKLYRLPYY